MKVNWNKVIMTIPLLLVVATYHWQGVLEAILWVLVIIYLKLCDIE